MRTLFMLRIQTQNILICPETELWETCSLLFRGGCSLSIIRGCRVTFRGAYTPDTVGDFWPRNELQSIGRGAPGTRENRDLQIALAPPGQYAREKSRGVEDEEETKLLGYFSASCNRSIRMWRLRFHPIFVCLKRWIAAAIQRFKQTNCHLYLKK